MEHNLKDLLSLSHKLKVLFVEDNKDVRIQLLKLLQNFFTDISIETDGVDAYEN